MKKITYQITLSDDAYIESIAQIERLFLFPVKKGNMTFKIEELREEDKPRPIIVKGVKFDSYADYIKSREEKE